MSQELSSKAQKIADEKMRTYEQVLERDAREKEKEINLNIQNLKDKKDLEYQEYQEKLENEYNEIVNDLTLTSSDLVNKILELQSELSNLKAKQDAYIQEQIRQEKMALDIEFYKVSVSKEDLIEINRLREVIPYFRNPRPLCKAIWESYFRTPTNDLINKLGVGGKTGIYKLTNLENGRAYIGQARDVGERFKQHIKAGLGIDASNADLYTAMSKSGVENFTFELIEECKASDLNEREKYYIDFYGTKDFGYNITGGGSRND